MRVQTAALGHVFDQLLLRFDRLWEATRVVLRVDHRYDVFADLIHAERFPFLSESGCCPVVVGAVHIAGEHVADTELRNLHVEILVQVRLEEKIHAIVIRHAGNALQIDLRPRERPSFPNLVEM